MNNNYPQIGEVWKRYGVYYLLLEWKFSHLFTALLLDDGHLVKIDLSKEDWEFVA